MIPCGACVVAPDEKNKDPDIEVKALTTVGIYPQIEISGC